MRALGVAAACSAASCATSARAAHRAPPRVALRRAQLGCSLRARRSPLTLAAEERGACETEALDAPSSSVVEATTARAAFASTPSLVKGLVSALTAAVNAAAGASAQPAAAPAVDVHAAPLSPAALHDGVRADFGERCYLWTGDISAELYDADCAFTDPTLSFTGLAAFQRNLAALQPVLRAVLRTREVDLLESSLTESGSSAGDDEEPQGFVEARWRMGADLALPWQPRIELTGRTRFYYSAARGGRIVRYFETWDIPATAALAQIVTPFAWKGERGAAADAAGL